MSSNRNNVEKVGDQICWRTWLLLSRYRQLCNLYVEICIEWI